MQMKCFFCHKPCHLIRRNEEDYHSYEMGWLCLHHPQVKRVKHVVQSPRYYQRSNPKISGSIRELVRVEVEWIDANNNGHYAHWQFDSDEPSSFYVMMDTEKKRPTNEQWWPDQKEVISIKGHPTGFTPENIAQKVLTYVVFA